MLSADKQWKDQFELIFNYLMLCTCLKFEKTNQILFGIQYYLLANFNDCFASMNETLFQIAENTGA